MQSSFLQNSAAIQHVPSRRPSRLTQQVHVLRSTEDCQNPPKQKSNVSPAATNLRNCCILIFSLTFMILNKLQRKLTVQKIHTKLLKRSFLIIHYAGTYFLAEWNVTC
jgi:hypothetical protein